MFDNDVSKTNYVPHFHTLHLFVFDDSISLARILLETDLPDEEATEQAYRSTAQ